MFAHSTCVHLSCPLRAFPVHLLLQVLSEMPAGTWREVGVGEKKAGDCSGRGGITMPLTPPALLRIVNAGGLSRAGGWGPASSLPPPHPSALTLPGTSSRLVFRPCLRLFHPPRRSGGFDPAVSRGSACLFWRGVFGRRRVSAVTSILALSASAAAAVSLRIVPDTSLPQTAWSHGPPPPPPPDPGTERAAQPACSFRFSGWAL